MANIAHASGITVHLWMAEKAAEYTQIPELHDFLANHQAAYANGSIFPDSGYIINHPYGEYAHWSGFLNAYYAEINSRCPNLDSEDCKDLFAHFLGALSHVVADINFDRHFVAEEGRQDYGGSVDEAQKYTDPGIDFLAIFEHKRAFKIPEYRLPADVLVDVFHRGGEVEALAEDILKAVGIVRVGLASEPLAAPFAYLYYKGKMPWGSQNYMDARGGVEDSANRIAKVWELVWLAYHRPDGKSKTLFRNEHAWPNADFYVDGYYLESF